MVKGHYDSPVLKKILKGSAVTQKEDVGNLQQEAALVRKVLMEVFRRLTLKLLQNNEMSRNTTAPEMLITVTLFIKENHRSVPYFR